MFPILTQEELAAKMLDKADIDPSTRSFQLSVSEIGRLCSSFHEMAEENPSLLRYKRSCENKDWETRERISDEQAENFEKNVLADEFY